MTKDYAHWRNAGSRRTRTRSRRGLVFAFLILLVMCLIYSWFQLSKQQRQTEPTPQVVVKAMSKEEQNKLPRFDFHDILPSQQVKVTEQGLGALTASTSQLTVGREVKKKDAVVGHDSTAAPTKVAQLPQSRKASKAKAITTVGRYFLQVASFVREPDAEKLQGHLVLLGFSASVERFQGQRILYYRVVLGPFSRLDIAQQTQRRLRRARFKSILLTMKHAPKLTAPTG